MMSDYNYTLSKDTTKAVPLYHHEQVPFQSFSRQSISSNTNSNNTNFGIASPLVNNNSMKGGDQNSVSGDLQDIIFSYQSQPELLRLILLSKLEEDKRRAEEAKLRAKELDLLLIQQQQQQQQQQIMTNNNDPMAFASSTTNTNTNNNNTFQQQQPSFGTSNFTMHPTPPISSNSSTDGRVFNHMRRTSLDAILASPTHCAPAPLLQQQQQQLHQQQQQHNHRRDSTLGSSFTGSADSEEFDDRTFSPIPTSTTTPVSASSLLQMESYGTTAAAVMSSLHQKQHPLSPSEYHLEEESFTGSLHHQIENRMLSSPSINSPAHYDFPARPRRRREMQAITKIVETREYPYVDGYFWKNNGNTVQKKTGNKSVYYKCSNSNKGCPVNKTVTWKDQGEYLIKYRGEHLLDCNKVQRIVDV